ncbi:DUF2267 domain-containing protein [Rhodobacter sp. Har01]|uniref:DUF2267 domain-containing protein n=1 Tax=Rhodobacter sp. Har01 TaxID=2883999 RepID=UPI001D070EC2|nr:DUF2267 domain-containing protein [Rhodobacter sp. Har01]MCB6177282.1 DUF2267 domain-containing protein [Rhodobacter sp. Har01]
MPMPWTYRQSTREWQAFLAHARDAMNLTSDNATFTAVEGVLRAFRRRLTPQQAIDFAQVLPATLRALFVADWHLADPIPPGTRADWTAEAQSLRPHHNLTPPNCVEATALALRKSILREDLDRATALLPPFATEFWSTPGTDPATLGPRIV